MRKWILRIHLYGGLICFWYLIIFAISSLHFHHHFGFMMKEPSVVGTQQMHLNVGSIENNSDLAMAIQQELDIPGWNLQWKMKRDSLNIFHMEVENLRMQYAIDYEIKTSQATVLKKNKGFWSMINVLHGFAGIMPGAPGTVVWEIFTFICVFVIIFSIGSGIWLWARKRKDQLIGWMIVLGLTSIAVVLMVAVYIGI